MCGIAGFVGGDIAPVARDRAVRAMCGAMAHRGPDDDGLFSSARASLGIRRLAIFDPANGHQPMRSPDGRFTIVFNGAIYNFRSLRADLAGTWDFRTECDTEVLLASFVHWRGECLRRLRGMYAFTVWDEQEQSLFLARDPFGIKPLFCHFAAGRLVFASEINALLASGHCSAELDPVAVADYLAWLAVPAPRTIYRGVTSLRPGESAVFCHGRLDVRPAWSFDAIPDTPVCRSRAEFLAQLRGRLEDSIRAHQAADVPVGAFLSGGLDSAAVVGLMSRTSGAALRTFSIGFEEQGYSEADAAAATARHLGTRHEGTVLRGADLARDVPTFLDTLDQPTGDGINTYYASRAARRGGVTVALSGLGGDELFGGYPSFRDIPRLARLLPVWRRMPDRWRDAAVHRLERGQTRQRKLADFLRHARTMPELGSLQRRVFPESDRRALLHGDARQALDGSVPFHPELHRLSAELAGAAAFETISAWELRTYMADVLLRDSDVMSMRHSLELRVPLIDRPLIEWLWRQPAAFKADGRRAKSALADALADVVPPQVRQGRKQGFTLPMVIWMKRELRPLLDETFSRGSVSRSGLFAPPAVQQLWQDFLGGNDARRWSRVWSLAVLIAFVNRRVAAPAAAAAMVELQTEARTAAPAGIASGGGGARPLTAPTSVAAATLAPPAAAPPAGQARTATLTGRTLMLAPEIFASEGGIPRILQTYLRALCELAEPHGSVQLLALNDAAITAASLERNAAGRVDEAVACRRRKARFVREALRMSRGGDRIVCGHVFLLPVAWLAQRLNPRLQYDLVAHGIEIWRPFTWKERVALRSARRIFCVSDYTRRELLRHCALRDGRAVVLHNALDPAFPIEPGRPLAECPPVILTVTRLTSVDRYKGVQHLIEAMPAIRAAVPDARLRIVGRGDDLARLQALRDSLRLSDAVEFTGYLEDRRLDDELRSCRLFALPSRKEGFGLVFLEAMAKGRPCIGAEAGGIPEVITAETGRLVAYGDVDGLVRACVGSLRRGWDSDAILARARVFSFPRFKARLGELLIS